MFIYLGNIILKSCILPKRYLAVADEFISSFLYKFNVDFISCFSIGFNSSFLNNGYIFIILRNPFSSPIII